MYFKMQKKKLYNCTLEFYFIWFVYEIAEIYFIKESKVMYFIK